MAYGTRRRSAQDLVFKGRGCLFTAQLGEAIGYEEGRFLVDSIMDDWRQDFRESYHYDVLRGDELRQLKDVLAQPSGLKPEGAPKFYTQAEIACAGARCYECRSSAVAMAQGRPEQTEGPWTLIQHAVGRTRRVIHADMA